MRGAYPLDTLDVVTGPYADALAPKGVFRVADN